MTYQLDRKELTGSRVKRLNEIAPVRHKKFKNHKYQDIYDEQVFDNWCDIIEHKF